MKSNHAVPPSAYLEEWIEDNRMDMNRFTDSSGLNPEDVNVMVRTGSLPYPGFAEELGKATDIPASAWKAFQKRYDDDMGRGSRYGSDEDDGQ